jgi:hypothetical protein
MFFECSIEIVAFLVLVAVGFVLDGFGKGLEMPFAGRFIESLSLQTTSNQV